MITVLAIIAAACFGLLMGGCLARAKECDFCAYKNWYIENLIKNESNE